MYLVALFIFVAIVGFSNAHSASMPVSMLSSIKTPLLGRSQGFGKEIATTTVPRTLTKERSMDTDNVRFKFEQVVRKAQLKICGALEKLDGGAKFKYDSWIRENGGGGVSAVLANGKVFEKAGVAVSVVYGTMPEEALKAANDRGFNRDKRTGAVNGRVPFFACGISSVIHPRNPHAPTMHFNYRYFETEGGQWWFGGGADITPNYIDKADMKHFHGKLKETCDKHDKSFYPKFKEWADEYFTITHRNETRGLGGIFFDDLNDRDPKHLVKFAEDCLDTIVPAYVPIVAKHKDDMFTAEEKRWQQLRRGRYTEFNLIYDRGTIFGLKTGGRVESILMTIPETARWEYMHEPTPGSREADIMDAFKHPRSWV